MKKISIFLISLFILVCPVVVSAEEENTTPTPTPTATPEPTSTPEPTPEPTSSPEPTPTATPEEDIVENTLSKIEVTGGTISPSFKSTVYNYTIKVTDESSFKISYEKSDDRTIAASPELSSSNQLDAIVKNGNKTTIKVTYTDDKGKQHINTYNITLDYVEPEKSAKLAKLKVEGYDFNEAFKNTTSRYSLEIPNPISAITITAEAEDSNATITYNGSESNVVKNLSVGENNIKVVVKNGKVTNTYYLNVTRKDEEDDTDYKAELEKLITKAEKYIKKLGDNLTEDEKTEIEELLKDCKDALENEKENLYKVAVEQLDPKVRQLSSQINELEKEEERKKAAETAEPTETKLPDANPISNRIIITLSTLFGFTLGGFGIYFFIKTSPKRMKKELLKEKESKDKEVKEEDSPIVEVEAKPVEEISEDDLVETKEFKIKDENKDA